MYLHQREYEGTAGKTRWTILFKLEFSYSHPHLDEDCYSNHCLLLLKQN